MIDKKKLFKIETISSLIITAFTIIVCSYFAYRHWGLISNPEQIQILIGSYGIFAMLILLLAQILQVVFPFLPGQLVSVAGGYLYGFWTGFTINLVGAVIGSLFAFLIAKRLGRPLVENIFKKDKIEKFDKFFHRHGLIIIFLARTQFFVPNDLLSYASGLIKDLNWKKYIVATILGYIPHYLLVALMADELRVGLFTAKMLSYALLAILIAIIYIFKDPIYRFIHKEELIIEKDVLKEERLFKRWWHNTFSKSSKKRQRKRAK